MKKEILVLSMIASLTGCDLDNSEAKKVPADFNNEFTTKLGFDGTSGEGLDVEITFGHGSASGVIGVTDVNYGEADPDYSLIPEAEFGTFIMTKEGDGVWTYDLDETHPQVAALQGNPSASLTDSITLTSLDGTTSQLNIIINGTPADSPAEFRGATVANVSLTETSAFGKAEVYDENFEQSMFKPVDEVGYEVVAKYGTFIIHADGRWEYELDKRHPDLQTLVTPEDATDETFTIYSADGTEVEFKVNITGAPLNFAVQIPSETDQTSIFAIDFLHGGLTPEDVNDGKITFRAKVTDDLATYGNFGFTCSRWNGNNDGGGDNRRLAQFWMQPEGLFEMWSAEISPGGNYQNGSADYAKDENNQFITEKVVFDQMFIPGEWVELVMSWTFSTATNLSYITLSFDDSVATSQHGAIPDDPKQKIVAQTVAGSSLYKCLDEARFYVRKNVDNGGVGAMLIDDIKFYKNIDADIKFDTPDFEESFSNNSDGDPVKASGEPRYQNVTTDNISVVRDL
ncbi:VCBS domain-containing protein [Psychrosphaera sp. B3R10]|uniref:VCBS domain-containing protein n=1 Tax=unclassified Psychrosphaera TaxID=2641570 RepID=UPI001C0826C5|nr:MULTISPECIES: VCBS domain-containing protein [unclassified Psychrosphaera]MBU2883531.1 VCBS domain-containing protein [Psychrosphaera sp. I2R16]MBU2989710.1 VCBS domain-containing protein [Psychrosphaera sp. B3R10]MDO6719836.1 VCBS domain-containing protein [Psychrosphaera sp. 1_MG-2023]